MLKGNEMKKILFLLFVTILNANVVSACWWDWSGCCGCCGAKKAVSPKRQSSTAGEKFDKLEKQIKFNAELREKLGLPAASTLDARKRRSSIQGRFGTDGLQELVDQLLAGESEQKIKEAEEGLAKHFGLSVEEFRRQRTIAAGTTGAAKE